MIRKSDPCPTCKHPQASILVCDECSKEVSALPVVVIESVGGDTESHQYCSIACLIADAPTLEGQGTWKHVEIEFEGSAVADLLRRLKLTQ